MDEGRRVFHIQRPGTLRLYCGPSVSNESYYITWDGDRIHTICKTCDRARKA